MKALTKHHKGGNKKCNKIDKNSKTSGHNTISPDMMVLYEERKRLKKNKGTWCPELKMAEETGDVYHETHEEG